jgi:hypothetical protein
MVYLPRRPSVLSSLSFEFKSTTGPRFVATRGTITMNGEGYKKATM